MAQASHYETRDNGAKRFREHQASAETPSTSAFPQTGFSSPITSFSLFPASVTTGAVLNLTFTSMSSMMDAIEKSYRHLFLGSPGLHSPGQWDSSEDSSVSLVGLGGIGSAEERRTSARASYSWTWVRVSDGRRMLRVWGHGAVEEVIWQRLVDVDCRKPWMGWLGSIYINNSLIHANAMPMGSSAGKV